MNPVNKILGKGKERLIHASWDSETYGVEQHSEILKQKDISEEVGFDSDARKAVKKLKVGESWREDAPVHGLKLTRLR